MSETETKKAESNDIKSEISFDENKKPKIKVEWSPENEKILVEWCDIAQCYKWLNMRAHAKYSYLHAWFTIPAIILSTISGTASFAQQSFPPSTQEFVPMAIGSLNIFIGMEACLNKDLYFLALCTVKSLPSMTERNNNSDKLLTDL